MVQLHVAAVRCYLALATGGAGHAQESPEDLARSSPRSETLPCGHFAVMERRCEFAFHLEMLSCSLRGRQCRAVYVGTNVLDIICSLLAWSAQTRSQRSCDEMLGTHERSLGEQ